VVTFSSTASRHAVGVPFAEALLLGQAPDGGLFVPESIPALELPALLGREFARRAALVLEGWTGGDIAPSILTTLCERAFDFPVPVVPLGDGISLVELFHGPTAAFKDVGARFLAHAMALLRDPERPLTILVATSGDTGSAVAHAFARMPAVRVVLLYPAGRVSPLQDLQLTAVPENVVSLCVEGTFDDCQGLVKSAFADVDLVQSAGLTSANSINIGRLLPQISYFVHAALEFLETSARAGAGMPRRQRVGSHDPVPPVVVVPSGNLGNLTAGLLAKRQGAPLGRFIAAVNRNDAFARWLATGKLRRERAVQTPSNAMDVAEPSNLVRLQALWPRAPESLRADMSAFSVSDAETIEEIRATHAQHQRLVCPHTAVGLAALRQYRAASGDTSPALVLATAHPGKFPEIIRDATGVTPLLPPALAHLERQRRAPRMLRADTSALRAVLRRMT
jgi:threonine synthase